MCVCVCVCVCVGVFVCLCMCVHASILVITYVQGPQQYKITQPGNVSTKLFQAIARGQAAEEFRNRQETAARRSEDAALLFYLGIV